MSIEVSTNRNTGVRQISIKRPDGSSVGTITIHSSSLKKLKKLGYKQRRISTMITQAATSGNARQVLASAKTETVNLRRKLASGQYNDREVRAAIRHAERMERVAKKRMKHLSRRNISKSMAAAPGRRALRKRAGRRTAGRWRLPISPK